MRETPDTGRKRIDLSVPQVAGSALAAVVAAKLASYFGVYGTILGAGVVSIVATCGGTLFQHFFRRTGEQLREKTVVAPRPGERTPAPAGEFTAGTVYRARVKSWRRPLVAAALVFGVTMAGITTYELVSGSSFSGGGGTTVSDAVSGRGASGGTSGDEPAPSDTPMPRRTPSTDVGTAGGTTHGATPGTGGSTSAEPDARPSGGPDTDPSADPSAPVTPAPTTSAPGVPVTTPTPPEPSASSRSGTDVPGQGGPAAR